MEKRWIEVKPFPDFKSQLRGIDKKQKCRKSWMAYKVNTDIAPECYLDKFIERGHFKEAATVSDKENLQLDFRLCEILRRKKQKEIKLALPGIHPKYKANI